MGSKSIIGKVVILRTEVKETLAGFEEDFNIPAFSIYSDDLFFTQGHIRADRGQPIFPVGMVSDAYNPGINRAAVLLILSDFYRTGQEIP